MINSTLMCANCSIVFIIIFIVLLVVFIGFIILIASVIDGFGNGGHGTMLSKEKEKLDNERPYGVNILLGRHRHK